MNARQNLLFLMLIGSLFSLAQTPSAAPGRQDKPAASPVSDPDKKSPATRGDETPSNEVTVQLEPPAAPAVNSSATTRKDDTEPDPKSPVVSDTAAPSGTQPSLTVQVEKLQTGHGPIDPKSVKLLAPFPAKALAALPPGWRLDASTQATPFIRNVDLAPGASITLKIRPHLLVPVADGAAAFAITEPGFKPALGYRQTHTVSAILTTSIQQLDEDAKHLGIAIEQLQQLVISLPQPSTPPPAPASATTTTTKPSNKR